MTPTAEFKGAFMVGDCVYVRTAGINQHGREAYIHQEGYPTRALLV